MSEQLLLDELRQETKGSTPAELTMLALDSLRTAEEAHNMDAPLLLAISMKQARVWARLAWESDKP